MMEKIKKNAIRIICILSFFTAFTYNEINLKHLPDDSKRDNVTVITSDDASYYNPPQEFIRGNGWQEDYWGAKTGYFIRPPGYGILYFIFLKITNFTSSLKLLKLFQLLLFSVSVYWFYAIALIVVKNKTLALAGSLVYGLSPFFIGFLYYTITEGITPALLLGFIYLLFKARQSGKWKNLFYFFASALFAYLFIVRPVLGIFGLLLPVFLYLDYRSKNIKFILARIFISGSVALSLMMIWQIRNYKIAGKYVGLHPIYFEDGNTIYREPFRQYWNFAKGWAEQGNVAFSYMIPLWEAAISGDTSIEYVNSAVNAFPDHVRKYFGIERLTKVLRDYQSSVYYQRFFYDKHLPMPMAFSPEEKLAIQEFKDLTTEYRSKFPVRYYLLSPIKVFRIMAFHSNLSLYIFQKTYRGTLLMEAMRAIFYAIHSLCFLVLFLSLFLFKKERLIQWSLAIVPFIYVFYLCFFQRGIEERYTLPVLPILFIGLLYHSKYFYFILKDKTFPHN